MAEKSRKYSTEDLNERWKDGAPSQADLDAFNKELQDAYFGEWNLDTFKAQMQAQGDAYQAWLNYVDEQRKKNPNFNPVFPGSGGTKTKDQFINEYMDNWSTNYFNERNLNAQDYYNEWLNSQETQNTDFGVNVDDYGIGTDKWREEMKRLYGDVQFADEDQHTPLSQIFDRYGIAWNGDNFEDAYLQAKRARAEELKNQQANSTTKDVADKQNEESNNTILNQNEGEKNKNANITAGFDAGTAGLLGSANASENSGSTAQATYNANQSNANANQAAYLQNMANQKTLQQMADNMKQGQGWNIAGATMQGIGTGASLGAGISDERLKESPDKQPPKEELDKLVKQFRSLYKQLQELKQCGM